MAEKKRLMAYPLIEEIEYRERIDTGKINRMLRSLDETTLRALLKSTEVKDYLDKLAMVTVGSYNALAGHAGSFDQYPTSSTDSVMFATAYDGIQGEGTSGFGRVDKLAGVVTLDWKDSRKSSKVPRVNGIVSPSVDIYIDDALRSQDDDVYNCLYRNNEYFWIENTATADHTMEIRLPPSLNKKFNYIEIVPLPIFGIEITQIRYYDEQSRAQDIYPMSSTNFYNGTGPLVFHLTPRSFNNTIKIWYTVKDNVGVMGFSKIDVGLIDYYNTEQTAYVKFNSTTGLTDITPTSISTDFYVDGSTDYNSFITELAIVNTVGGTNLLTFKPSHEEQTSLGGVTVDASSGLYLKIKMKEVDMTTPVFRGCKMEYTEV